MKSWHITVWAALAVAALFMITHQPARSESRFKQKQFFDALQVGQMVEYDVGNNYQRLVIYEDDQHKQKMTSKILEVNEAYLVLSLAETAVIEPDAAPTTIVRDIRIPLHSIHSITTFKKSKQ